MKFKITNIFVLSIFSLILTSQISQAQPSREKPANANKSPATANDWSQFTKTQEEFTQGCVGQQNPDSTKLKIKQNFCKCALNAYTTRYKPQIFFQINALAIQVGKDGPTLVNLMMKPELDKCSVQTKYTP